MLNKNEILRLIVSIVITALLASFIATLSNKSNATQSDVINVKNECNQYTDRSIQQHERVQSAQFESLTKSINSVDENTKANKDILQKLLDIQLKK